MAIGGTQGRVSGSRERPLIAHAIAPIAKFGAAAIASHQTKIADQRLYMCLSRRADYALQSQWDMGCTGASTQ
jgi:hypothetical protein